jgi:hypothetical protein
LAAAAQAGRFNDNFSLEHVEDVGKNMEKWLTKGMDTHSHVYPAGFQRSGVVV